MALKINRLNNAHGGLNIFLFLTLLAVITPAKAESVTQCVYMEPDSVLIELVDTEWAPWVSISPDFSSWLLRTPLRTPSIAELAEEEFCLAGMRFSPSTSAPSRSRRYIDLSLLHYPELEGVEISGLPENPRILRTAWSPDGSKIAFTNETSEGVELWVIDVASATAVPLTGPVLSLTANEWPKWLSSSDGIICCMIPEDRDAPPTESNIPTGPNIQVADGTEAPVRTYQDLLETPYDWDLFEYYLTSQLVAVRLDGNIELLGEPQIIWYFKISPNAEYVLVSSLQRPFSNMVTAGRFSERIEIWDIQGNPLIEIADFPVRESIPIAVGSTYEGPRSLQWRADAEAVLCWVEALDGGDAGSEAVLRDRVYMLPAPFDAEPVILAELEGRFSGIQWGNDTLALVGEWWWNTRNNKMWRVSPNYPDTAPELLFDYSWEDIYNLPGVPLTRKNQFGENILLTADNGMSIFLEGKGASLEGDMPFIDKVCLENMESIRIFRSSPPYYENPIKFVDSSATLLLIRRESVSEFPNYFVIDPESDEETQITFFEHPTPQLIDIQKEIITYEREDGIPLSGTLYLPPGYTTEYGTLPLLMWAYPEEFKTASAAGQISGSPYEFDYIGWWSPMIWLSMGYAVLDGPSMPIVGEGDEQPNDTFVEQLVMNASAAVDKVVEMGVADPLRIAIGGHSYGAFMTANLLAHTDLFAAGLARTGAYNRTLTPFGFQSEDRSFWEAPDVYEEMSPFMHADIINEPILIIHGEADNNSGTFPLQSERFFAALKGLGGIARLVMLPLESHSYQARESILHVLWETQEWLDIYLTE